MRFDPVECGKRMKALRESKNLTSRRAAENGIAYVIGMAAADTDDADAAFPQGGGNGRDRIGRIVHMAILLS